MQNKLLAEAFSFFLADKLELAEQKLLEYKQVCHNDYALFIDNSEYYDLEYILFSINVLLQLKLNEFIPRPVSVSLYYNFCYYIDNGKFHDLFSTDNENLQKLTYEVLQTYPELYDENGELKFDKVMHRDKEFILKTRVKVLFFEYFIKRYGEILESKSDNEINTESIKIYSYFVKFILKLNSNLIDIIKKREREKILADLSHRIKNLISNITGNLEQLKDDKNSGIIKNAVKGNELICNIIEGFNYSGTGAQADFIYDAENADNGILLTDILINAIVASLENMFFGKWFKKHMNNYFKHTADAQQAKKELANLDKSLPQVEAYCHRWFFNCSFNFTNIEQLMIGKTKGSDIKLYILFQEIIFNAVKYTSFVKRTSRMLNIDIKYSIGGIHFIANNSYRSGRRERGTGLGLYIVESMVSIMGAKYKLDKTDDVYIVDMQIPDYWRENKSEQANLCYSINEPVYLEVGETAKQYS